MTYSNTSVLNEGLCDKVEHLVPLLCPERPLLVTSKELRIGRHGSMTINRQKGVFYDHELGTGGDMLSLIQHARGCGFREAVKWASRFLGSYYTISAKLPNVQRSPQQYGEQRVRKAHLIWQSCAPVEGTVAERYLQEQRGLRLPIPRSVRFHPQLSYARNAMLHFPALVAVVQNSARQIIGVQATYLTNEGKKIEKEHCPARLSIGVVKGGAVRLSLLQEKLIVCEGLEDGLSLLQARPHACVWVCLGTSGLRSVALPDSVKEVVIAADSDAAGKQAAEALRSRLWEEERRVAIITPSPAFKDFNDELRRKK